MQPTALGNQFEALDRYALARYGCETSGIWKRLWGILPDDKKREITDAQVEVSQFVQASFCALGLSILVLCHWLIGLEDFRRGAHVDWKPILFIGTSLLAWRLCYRAAIHSFSNLSEGITAMVDLHRLPLIAALGYEAPATVTEERALFESLKTFWSQGTALPVGQLLLRPPLDSLETGRSTERP